MSNKLVEKEWREFFISEIFMKIQRGKRLTKGNQQSGETPYVSSTASNNGVDNFIGNSKGVRTFENCLTLANSGSVGSTFFHHYTFVASDHVTALILEKPNKYIYLFLSGIIRRLEEKYSFNREINDKRIQREKILLPVNSDSLPDWQFMEDFIKQKEQKQIADLKDYYADKAVELMISTGSLKNTCWKSFFIGGKEGIFQIKATKSGIDKNKLKVAENGKTPYITRSDMNNGINLFVSDEQMPKYKKDDGNVITIGLDTQTVFYQKNSFWTGQNIQVLSNDNLNYWVAMFIIPLLKIQMKKFAWGSTGATLGRLNRTRIMLPVNSDGLPDWQFMEDFMKQIERDKITAVLSYYNNSLNNNSLRGGVERWMPSENRWAAFAIQDICEIVSGQDIYERERITGNTPYITATANNNGIGYFISNQNTTLEKDCISVNRNGSVGYAFYHPYYALFGNDTRKLRPKYLNKYTSLFLTACIEKQRVKYGYGYKMGTERLKKQKILLPVNADNQPDWTNIERFMQRIELEKIVCYLKSRQQLQFPGKTV